ncbi:hypothetical protein BB560_001264 [Smittium megazygosporum]|uniref:Uncharacterized protein n=1 Tax=Smittium megazygosporum TaxID=133381 RepID=A0A2T9ZI26_9FUNG|nr:hypothetical protein BB560_001264 [Smittium megazygosporum]
MFKSIARQSMNTARVYSGLVVQNLRFVQISPFSSSNLVSAKQAKDSEQNFSSSPEEPFIVSRFGTKIFHRHTMPDKSVFEARIPIIEEAPTITYDMLPPPINKSVKADGSYTIDKFDESQIEEIKRLRKEDPAHWTRGILAKKFGCKSIVISKITKCPSWRLEEIRSENDQKWLKMGFKKRLILTNRLKRRLAW